MADEFLGDRKKALEESFFAKENARLVERLRSAEHKKASREALSHVSGISDLALIDKLVELEIESDTWAALALIPLVEIAWADGKVADKERLAVLAGAEASGVASASPSYHLLESWLSRRPDGRLLEIWGEYIVGLCAHLGAEERNAVKQEILGRARRVAESAGGILGLGHKISREEEVVLQELEKAFGR